MDFGAIRIAVAVEEALGADLASSWDLFIVVYSAGREFSAVRPEAEYQMSVNAFGT